MSSRTAGRSSVEYAANRAPLLAISSVLGVCSLFRYAITYPLTLSLKVSKKWLYLHDPMVSRPDVRSRRRTPQLPTTPRRPHNS
jgi:hypothetical protein